MIVALFIVRWLLCLQYGGMKRPEVLCLQYDGCFVYNTVVWNGQRCFAYSTMVALFTVRWYGTARGALFTVRWYGTARGALFTVRWLLCLQYDGITTTWSMICVCTQALAAHLSENSERSAAWRPQYYKAALPPADRSPVNQGWKV